MIPFKGTSEMRIPYEGDGFRYSAALNAGRTHQAESLESMAGN